ncbi:MAG: hypothetical protein GX989_02960 [Firmicutes bacterium]|nr:hypothetical protein [Bacillota bacterium]
MGFEESILFKFLNGEDPGEIPVIATGTGLAARIAGRSAASLRDNGAALAEVMSMFQKEAKLDWTIVYTDALAIPETLGVEVELSPISGAIGKPMKIPDDPVLSPKPLRSSPATRATLEAVEILSKKKTTCPIAVTFEGPLTTSINTFDANDLIMAIYRRPLVVKSIISQMTDILCSFAEEIRRAGASVFYIPDPFSSMDTLSPKHYKEFAGPYVSNLISHIHDLGAKAILHICGQTDQIWDYMAETGADTLSLDQIMSLQKAREHFGPEVRLAGNVDPIRTLWEGSVEEVRDETMSCIEDAGPRSLIIMPGCAVPTQTDIKNLRAMSETAKGYSYS